MWKQPKCLLKNRQNVVQQYNGLFSHEKEWSTGVLQHYAKKPVTRDDILYDSILCQSRKEKSIETESKLVVAHNKRVVRDGRGNR